MSQRELMPNSSVLCKKMQSNWISLNFLLGWKWFGTFLWQELVWRKKPWRMDQYQWKHIIPSSEPTIIKANNILQLVSTHNNIWTLYPIWTGHDMSQSGREHPDWKGTYKALNYFMKILKIAVLYIVVHYGLYLYGKWPINHCIYMHTYILQLFWLWTCPWFILGNVNSMLCLMCSVFNHRHTKLYWQIK